MREYSILFSAPMVQALRAERKTQTRRTRGLDKINEAPDAWVVVTNEFDRVGFVHFRYMQDSRDDVWVRCPYGVAGDRLRTRETWSANGTTWGDWTRFLYRSDHGNANPCDIDRSAKWRPSIHMPLWASRDTLEVISARPERLHDLTRADAYAEGITAGDSFPNLWDLINGPGSWAKNLWVWRVEFRRIA